MTTEDREPIAIASMTVYIVLGKEGTITGRGNAECWAATEDPDEYANDVLRVTHPDPLPGPLPSRWEYRNGDDHGKGIVSYTYFANVYDHEELDSVADYAGGWDRYDAENMGLLTEPEEWGHIPWGLSWSLDGMDWNMGGVTRLAGVDFALFPISEGAYRHMTEGAGINHEGGNDDL